MIKQEITSSPFIFFLFLNILFFLLGLYRHKINRYFSFYKRFWDIHIENILLVSMCIASITFIDNDAGLFELTKLQIIIILIVCKDYAYDLGKCFILSSDFSWPIVIYSPCFDTIAIAHHVIGLIGCGYLLWRCCGGCVIIRLLLDILTNFVPHLRDNYPQWFYGSMFHQRFCENFSWIICVSIRLIYYPMVLVESLLTIWRSMSMTDENIHHYILFIFFTCWLIFSTIYHIAWMRDVYNDDDNHSLTKE